MPNIPNFPASFLEEHKRWHHSHHHNDPSSLPAGYGQEFLNFHRQFIRKVLQWYSQQGYDQRLVSAWQNVPEPIRNTACYDQNAEYRVRNNPRSFASADELGIFLESSNLHGCIHEEAARIYGEEALYDFDIAPQTTMFYNIHGLIDQWYQQWERAMGYRSGNGENGRILDTHGQAVRGKGRGWHGNRTKGKIIARSKRSELSSGKQAVRSRAKSRPLTRTSVKRGTHRYSTKPVSARSVKLEQGAWSPLASRSRPARRPRLSAAGSSPRIKRSSWQAQLHRPLSLLRPAAGVPKEARHKSGRKYR